MDWKEEILQAKTAVGTQWGHKQVGSKSKEWFEKNIIDT